MAGFVPDQLEITVIGGQLLISSEGVGEVGAARRFRRAFRLAPGLDVAGAEFDRGLQRIAPDLRPPGHAARTIAVEPWRS